MVLTELIETGAKIDLMREILSFAAERLMDAGVEAALALRTVLVTGAAGAAQRLPRAGLGHPRRADRA